MLCLCPFYYEVAISSTGQRNNIRSRERLIISSKHTSILMNYYIEEKKLIVTRELIIINQNNVFLFLENDLV